MTVLLRNFMQMATNIVIRGMRQQEGFHVPAVRKVAKPQCTRRPRLAQGRHTPAPRGQAAALFHLPALRYPGGLVPPAASGRTPPANHHSTALRGLPPQPVQTLTASVSAGDLFAPFKDEKESQK